MSLYYGTKEWANNLLRIGVDVCKKRYGYTVLSNKIQEVKYYVETLREYGFWWQANILTNWLNRMKHNHKGIKKRTVKEKPQKVLINKQLYVYM